MNNLKYICNNLLDGEKVEVYVLNISSNDIRKLDLTRKAVFEVSEYKDSIKIQTSSQTAFYLNEDSSASYITYCKKAENAFVWALSKEDLKKSLDWYLNKFKEETLRSFDCKHSTEYNVDEFIEYAINNNMKTIFQRFVRKFK